MLPEDRGIHAAQIRRLLYEQIAKRANADGTSAFPGDTFLQKTTGVSARNLPRLRNQLRALGLIAWQLESGKKIVYTVTVEGWPKVGTISGIFRTPASMEADPCHDETVPLPRSQPTPAMIADDPCHGEHPDPCQVGGQEQQSAEDTQNGGPSTVPSLPSHIPSPPTATANSTAEGGERADKFLNAIEDEFAKRTGKIVAFTKSQREILTPHLAQTLQENMKAFLRLIERPNGWEGLANPASTIIQELPVYIRNPVPEEHLKIVERVWEYYLTRLKKNAGVMGLTPMRIGVGLARLKECGDKTGGDMTSAEELMKLAVDTLASSKFHRGENNSHRAFDSWENNLFKTTEQMEQWLEAA